VIVARAGHGSTLSQLTVQVNHEPSTRNETLAAWMPTSWRSVAEVGMK
jgi:hypothetical protein